jgi:hypothetical protein
MLEGPIGFTLIGVVGTAIALIAGYFSPAGLKSLGTLAHWSVVAGTITPALLFLAWTYQGRFKSEDYPMMMAFVFMVLAADFFVGTVLGFYLKSPAILWLRYAIGFAVGALTMVWVLWAK